MSTASTPRPDFGRIRLERDQALLLQTILQSERHLLVIERARLKGLGEPVAEWNKHITKVSRVIDEVGRLLEEKGW